MKKTENSFSLEEIQLLRKETAGCSSVIHLNNAGASLMPDPVTQTVLDHINLEANIGGYEAAALRAAEIKEFYNQAAKLLNCKADNIAFTSSATDSYSRALSSIPFKAGEVILTSNDDFISNQIQFLSLQKRFGIKIVRVGNAKEGGVDLNDLDDKLKTLRPRFLSITHIPTNSGLVQPVKQIGEIVSKYDTVYLLDACQSIGQMKLDVQELKCDFLSATNRKFLRGPRGTGLLYVSDKALASGLEPLFVDMRGADWIEKDKYQPRDSAIRFEDWEFAYALVLGSRAAIEYCLRVGEDRIRNRVRELANYTRQQLSAFSNVKVLDRGSEVGALVTFHAKNSDAAFIVQKLLSKKINVVSSYRNVAVIDFDEKKVPWAVRVSPHYYNIKEEIDQFIDELKKII
jgi:selenocysteine lyase/cysteine desulfurase